MEENQITVTSPLLPSLDDFLPYLEDIWKRKWITNNGYYHQELEKALCQYLKVPYISLFTNGTLPLICSLQALRITGEVITTPYSFVATTHAYGGMALSLCLWILILKLAILIRIRLKQLLLLRRQLLCQFMSMEILAILLLSRILQINMD